MSKRFFSNWSMWHWLSLGALTAFGIFQLTRSSKKGAKVTTPAGAPAMLSYHLNNWLVAYGYDKNILPYILTLSALESGNWTSSLWSYFNNPWGMKNPEQRKTTSLGPTPGVGNVPAGFAIYLSATKAAEDFVLYLNAKNSPKNFKRFYDFIAWIQDKGYEPELTTWEYFTRCLNAA